jgi:hypothetical protein
MRGARRTISIVRAAEPLMDVTARARVRMDTALAAKYCRDAVELLVGRSRHIEPG